MGRYVVNTHGWSATYEPGQPLGYTISIGISEPVAFYTASPLVGYNNAQIVRDAAVQGYPPASIRALMPPPMRAWFDALATMQPAPVDLQAAALYAAALGPMPGRITAPPGPPPY